MCTEEPLLTSQLAVEHSNAPFYLLAGRSVFRDVKRGRKLIRQAPDTAATERRLGLFPDHHHKMTKFRIRRRVRLLYL